MGLYKDVHILLEFIRDNPQYPYTYADAPKYVAQHTKLSDDRARQALYLAIDLEFIKPPPKDKKGNDLLGEHCSITEKAKRHLKKRFAITDLFIASYHSAPNFLAFIAIIISIIAIIVSIFT